MRKKIKFHFNYDRTNYEYRNSSGNASEAPWLSIQSGSVGAKKKGFDFSKTKEGLRKKYSEEVYFKGKYRTKVAALKGDFTVSEYAENGPIPEKTITLAEGAIFIYTKQLS